MVTILGSFLALLQIITATAIKTRANPPIPAFKCMKEDFTGSSSSHGLVAKNVAINPTNIPVKNKEPENSRRPILSTRGSLFLPKFHRYPPAM